MASATLASPPQPRIATAASVETETNHSTQRRGEVAATVKSEFWRGRPLMQTVIFALLGALALQLWRPCFFLTDDTLSGWLPVAVEAFRRLWEGRSPFVNDYIFGGNVNLLQDPGAFGLWNPWALLFSWLAKTPYYWLLADVVGTLSLIAIAAAFCWAALRLRRHFTLPISDAGLVLLSLSYAFTPFNFIVGASWIGFLNAPAALPLILAASFERDMRKAVLIALVGLLYALFGGHSHPFVMLLFFGGLLTLSLSVARRNPRPILVWVSACTLTVLLALPLLWPALHGFGQTTRNLGLTAARASVSNVTPFPLLASFAFGPLSQSVLSGIKIDLSDPLYNLAIAFSLVNLPLLGVLAVKCRWNATEVCLLAAALFTALCIVRPLWLGEVFVRLPLLKSLRWPFREIGVLHFFTHALFLLSFRPVAKKLPAALLSGGAALAYALIFLCVAPTFWLFALDRRLVISGEADRYWNELKRAHPVSAGAPPFVVEAPPRFVLLAREAVPFSLLAGYNFASLFRVTNVSGYSPTPPPSARWLQEEVGAQPYFWGGIFHRPHADVIVAARPAVQRITLTGLFPATWQIFHGADALRFELNADSGRVRHLSTSEPANAGDAPSAQPNPDPKPTP